MMDTTVVTNKPSGAKPWLKHYNEDAIKEKVPECSLYEYVYLKNKDHPEDKALKYFDNDITYRELFENIRKVAASYTALGVKAGDIVIVCSVTTPEIVYTFYALDLIGAVPNMVDPRTSAEGIHEYIKEVNSEYICVLNAAYPRIREACAGTNVKKIVVVSPDNSLRGIGRIVYRLTNKDKNEYASDCIRWEHFIAEGAKITVNPAPYSHEHCGAIMHTGGTTGMPKGVMLTDDTFNAIAFQFEKSMIDLKRGHRFLNVMPPFIAYGFACGIHMPLTNGLTSVIIPNLKPQKLGSLLLKYKPEHMCGVPLHFQVLVHDKKLKNADLSFLINSGSGGDGITVGSEEEVNRFLKAHGCKYPLTKGYGMTELGSAVCNCMKELNKVGSVGLPLVKNVVSAFEPGTDTELDIGQKGEICITGPTVMLGYYGKPEETENVLHRHSDGKTWVHTGDLGYIDEDGYVFINGRIKRMIVRHDGFKVFPSMIENVISLHPAVETCSVVAFKDQNNLQGDLPFAHIVLKKDVEQSQKQIQSEIAELCREKLPEYAQPVGYKLREALYYTPIGKVDYRRLEMESV